MNFMKSFHCLLALALSLSVLSAMGCGGGESVYPVTGKVTYPDGTPLSKGQVIFESDNFSAFGPIQEDGTYAMTSYKEGDGVPQGTYQVYLGGDVLGGYPTEGGPGGPLVARKYQSAAESGLTCEVTGKRTFDFQVERP